jgi:hypothetical protein
MASDQDAASWNGRKDTATQRLRWWNLAGCKWPLGIRVEVAALAQ